MIPGWCHRYGGTKRAFTRNRVRLPEKLREKSIIKWNNVEFAASMLLITRYPDHVTLLVAFDPSPLSKFSIIQCTYTLVQNLQLATSKTIIQFKHVGLHISHPWILFSRPPKISPRTWEIRANYKPCLKYIFVAV